MGTPFRLGSSAEMPRLSADKLTGFFWSHEYHSLILHVKGKNTLALTGCTSKSSTYTPYASNRRLHWTQTGVSDLYAAELADIALAMIHD